MRWFIPYRSLRAEIASLRSEIAALRVELAQARLWTTPMYPTKAVTVNPRQQDRESVARCPSFIATERTLSLRGFPPKLPYKLTDTPTDDAP